MKTYNVEIEHRHVCRYTVDAEDPRDAMERVLAGQGIEADPDHPEPHLRVREQEGCDHGHG